MDDFTFPDPLLAPRDGLVAYGGDLSLGRLLAAYKAGIFPWFSDDSPVLWWSPDPRCVLFPKKVRISESLSRTLKKGLYSFTVDRDFEKVINNCAIQKRAGQDGTWITSEMQEAYINLHLKGIAHSIEVWNDNVLVGGLYGVALGSMFFGESMFSLKRDASKCALVYLCQKLSVCGYDLVDCQNKTAHLISMGAEIMDRVEFINNLQKMVINEPKQLFWKLKD